MEDYETVQRGHADGSIPKWVERDPRDVDLPAQWPEEGDAWKTWQAEGLELILTSGHVSPALFTDPATTDGNRILEYVNPRADHSTRASRPAAYLLAGVGGEYLLKALYLKAGYSLREPQPNKTMAKRDTPEAREYNPYRSVSFRTALRDDNLALICDDPRTYKPMGLAMWWRNEAGHAPVAGAADWAGAYVALGAGLRIAHDALMADADDDQEQTIKKILTRRNGTCIGTVNQNQAIQTVFGNEADRVDRIFSTYRDEGLDAIIVFTGYGFELADRAVSLAEKNDGAEVLIVGPDSIPWSDNPKASAMDYREYIGEKYADAALPLTRVIADSRPETSYTNGQARAIARVLFSQRYGAPADKRDNPWGRIALIAAAYHLPRAYLTLLNALRKHRLQDDVVVHAVPYTGEARDWSVPDKHLTDHASWLSSLSSESERIRKYQAKPKQDVASWEELDTYLARHEFG